MTARILVIGLVIVVSGCGQAIAPGSGLVQLPPPDEAHRARHPAGYSMVFPADLLPQVNPQVYQGDFSTKDALANSKPKNSQRHGAIRRTDALRSEVLRSACGDERW